MKVQLLTAPDCASCMKVERLLVELKIPYETIDIMKNPAMLRKYPVMSVPGVIIDGKIAFVGVPTREELRIKLKL